MSVVIENMELPSMCEFCRFKILNTWNTTCCWLTPDGQQYKICEIKKKRQAFCPLKNIVDELKTEGEKQ